MFEWFAQPDHMLIVLAVFALGISHVSGKQDVSGFLRFYRFLFPVAFAWVALVIARNLGWTQGDQYNLIFAVFFGCLGLVGQPVRGESKKPGTW